MGRSRKMKVLCVLVALLVCSCVCQVPAVNCTYFDPDTNCTYDLSGMTQPEGVSWSIVLNNGIEVVDWNICAPVSDLSQTNSQSNNGVSQGRLPGTFFPLNGSSANSNETCSGLVLLYNNGHDCATTTFSTEIEITCDPSLDPSTPDSSSVPTGLEQINGCAQRITMRSFFACGTKATYEGDS